MERKELLEKKMIVGDLDGDSIVKFLKKYGIEYYNIQECKTNWISINKNGEIAYYLRENGYNECPYPEIDLGDIIYQDMMNSLLLPPNTMKRPQPPATTPKEDNRTEWDRLIAECEKNIVIYNPTENENKVIVTESYIDGKRFVSIELDKSEDEANCDLEAFTGQLEKQQENLIKAVTGKFARYEKVLVRANTKMPWLGQIFISKNGPYHECVNGKKYLCCIPFDPEKLGRVTE